MNSFEKTDIADKDLDNINYNLNKISEEFDYIKKSSFWKNVNPCIVIFGGNNWLSRYLLHFFTEYKFDIAIMFIGFAIPEYLQNERYQKIVLLQINSLNSIAEHIKIYKPQIAFYANNERNMVENSFLKLYHKNVSQVEKICQIIKNTEVQKFILFSDSCIYESQDSEIKEGDATHAYIPLAKSYEEMEQVALQYNVSHQFEIYCLRLACVYGPMIPDGVMRISYIMANGYLFGPPENASKSVAVIHGKDVVLSSFLLMLAPKPGYQIFNITDKNIPLEELLNLISRQITKKKLLGIPTKFAEILGLGYQENITVSQQFFTYSGIFYEHANDFFNQLRFCQKDHIFNENVTKYILHLSSTSNKRFRDMFGWFPDANIEEHLVDSLAKCEKTNWEIFNTTDTYDEYTQKTLIPLYDQVAEILEQLHEYTQDLNKENKEISFSLSPFLEVNIDIKSFYIFFQEIWNYIPHYLGKNNKKQSIPEVIGNIGQVILHILRYEHSVFERKYPDNVGQQIFYLTQKFGEFSGQKVKFYTYFAILSKAILEITKFFETYSDFIEVLPEKNCGIFFYSEIGDVGLQIKVRNNHLKISSLRKDLDNYPPYWSFEKKLAEFKKAGNLYLCAGIHLQKFIDDCLSGNLTQRFIYNLGKYYFLVELEKKHLEQISKVMGAKKRNIHCLFVNSEHQIKFGISINNGKLNKVNESFLEMINNLLSAINDVGEVAKMLENSGEKEEKFFFLNIRTVKKLLSSKFSNLLLKWLLRNEEN